MDIVFIFNNDRKSKLELNNFFLNLIKMCFMVRNRILEVHIMFLG